MLQWFGNLVLKLNKSDGEWIPNPILSLQRRLLLLSLKRLSYLSNPLRKHNLVDVHLFCDL